MDNPTAKPDSQKPFLPYRTWILMVILTIVVAVVSNTGGFDNIELLFNR